MHIYIPPCIWGHFRVAWVFGRFGHLGHLDLAFLHWISLHFGGYLGLTASHSLSAEALSKGGGDTLVESKYSMFFETWKLTGDLIKVRH